MTLTCAIPLATLVPNPFTLRALVWSRVPGLVPGQAVPSPGRLPPETGVSQAVSEEQASEQMRWIEALLTYILHAGDDADVRHPTSDARQGGPRGHARQVR